MSPSDLYSSALAGSTLPFRKGERSRFTKAALWFGLSFNLLLLALLGSGCSKSINHDLAEPVSRKPIEQVLQEQTPRWMALPGVVGTAIGLHQDQPCIKVLVITSTDELVNAIPSTVEGYRVVIEATGEINALDRP